MSEKAKDVLVQRAAQISNAAEILAAQTSDWQVIQAYVSGRLLDLKLTSIQEEKLARYQFVYNQLVSGKYTESEVCEMVQHNHGLSYIQALQDIRDSKEIFASSANLHKMFELKMQLELNMQWTQMAIAQGDMRAASAFDKNRAKLISMMPEEEDTSAADFQPHVNVFTFDPSLLGFEQFDQKQVAELVRDIKAKYPGEIDLNLGYEDAEVITES